MDVRTLLPLALLAVGCGPIEEIEDELTDPPCDTDDGGLELLPGFCASRVAEDLGNARHMVVVPNGDLYVATWVGFFRDGEPGLYGLRDEDDDGIAEIVEQVADEGGNGLAYRDGWLYLAENDQILRWALPEDDLLSDSATPEIIVTGLPDDGDHFNKSIALDDDGNLFVNIGSASNSCQLENRKPGSPGEFPCPELDTRAGIWRFDADELGQTQDEGERWATGVRNAVALTWNPATDELLAASNGRDSLHDFFPDLYSPVEELVLPSDQLFVVEQGADYGWPYCYHDPVLGMVQAPEYGSEPDLCGDVTAPDYALPPHWAPLSMALTSGTQLPAPMDDGLLIAFHGSSQGLMEDHELLGYRVSFLNWTGERAGGPENPPLVPFAWDFAGPERPLPQEAEHRPVGLAFAPDGSLYISDDMQGDIWRVTYTGD